MRRRNKNKTDIKTMKQRKIFLPSIMLIAIVIAGLVYFYFFSSMLKGGGSHIVYIDSDDNIDSVCAKLEPFASSAGMAGFKTMVRHSSYADKIRTGRYVVEPGNGAFAVFRKLKNGLQSPVSLTIPEARTADRLAGAMARKLMVDSLTLYNVLSDSATCAKYGYTPETMICMFVPNTYDIYWNTSVDKLLDRMKNESAAFWTAERVKKAEALGLTKEQVMTLASIVDEETANTAEKSMIAGMYYNRLKADMPLQADPTIKFALNDFSIRRIYNNMLAVNSPYNTYKNTGLPPGPIKVPSVAGIDAVLNLVRHNYLYMCAKEDFSGTHNFAATYDEHLSNAKRYAKALNERGVK